MAKFKVGDKVRAHYIPGVSTSNKQCYDCRECTIDKIRGDGFYNGFIYSLKGEDSWWWSADELELVKPKFNPKKYKGRYALRCKTLDQAKIFDRYNLTKPGIVWYISAEDKWDEYKDRTCLFFNESMYGTDMHENYTYLNFEDFDWSDFEMNTNKQFTNKQFTKKDLKNGDVVKLDHNEVGIVCVDTGVITFKSGFDHLSSYTDDLIHEYGAKIMAVRRPEEPGDCQFCAFDYDWGKLVYERKEVEEMTLEEVCKALGKDIKIVKR